MATENASCGHLRIQSEPTKPGRSADKTTIATTPRHSGIEPSPDRPTSCRALLKAHADIICGADFPTTNARTKRGPATRLLAIHHATSG